MISLVNDNRHELRVTIAAELNGYLIKRVIWRWLTLLCDSTKRLSTSRFKNGTLNDQRGLGGQVTNIRSTIDLKKVAVHWAVMTTPLIQYKTNIK